MSFTIRLWHLLSLCMVLLLTKLLWYPDMSYLWVTAPLWAPYLAFLAIWSVLFVIAIILTPFGLAKWTLKPTPKVAPYPPHVRLQKVHSVRKKDSNSFGDLRFKL